MFNKLLSTPTAQLGRVGRFAFFQIRLWYHCAKLLRKNRAGTQAAALAYHTIFGIIPLAVVTLLIFHAMPAYSEIGDKVQTFIEQQLHLSALQFPDPKDTTKKIMLTEHLNNIVGDIFLGLSRGTIALISAVIIIWAALALLSTIERAFNNIWHVGRPRGFLQRIINYWALLTLGPFLFGLAIYIATQSAFFGQLGRTLFANFAPVISYLIATVAFFLLYYILPNTKVQAKVAIWGAALAALVWSIVKWLFALYLIKFLPYSKVYGALGLIPLSVLWIYITWLIVLFGLQLTFTMQHLTTLESAELAEAKRRQYQFIANDITALNVVREIAEAFEQNNAPVEPEVILSRLNIPAEFGDRLFALLIEKGLIARTSEPKVGLLPAKDPANITLDEISKVLAGASFAQLVPNQPGVIDQITKSQHEVLSKYNLRQILTQKQTQ
jgi:membrane protein